MKVSLIVKIIALITLAAFGAADTKGLRSSASVDKKPTTTIETQVDIHGIITGTGEDHGDALAKCFVEAYNQRDMMGFEAESFTFGHEVDVPDDVENQKFLSDRRLDRTTIWGWPNYFCNLRCRRDHPTFFESPLEFFQALDHPSAAKLHAEFEESLCDCLRDSGTKAYKHAKDCSVQYMYSPTPPVLTESE